MKVGVFGGGFVGLTLAAHLLKSDVKQVTVIDNDSEKLESFHSKKFLVREPGLDTILIEGMNSTRLIFATSASDLDGAFICIGTPRHLTYEEQVESIMRVALVVAKSLKNSGIMFLRSTVPVGTTAVIRRKLFERGFSNLIICFAPERTAEGVALEELAELPQILGTESISDELRATEFLRDLNFKTISCENTQAAEMVKLVCNAWRDTTFAFANEVAFLCERIGINAYDMIQSANQGYPRSAVPRPGHVGGPCLSKDAYILLSRFPDYDTSVIRTARGVNESVVQRIYSYLWNRYEERQNVVVQFIGASFKGNPPTNDVRQGIFEEFVNLHQGDLSSKFYLNLWDESLSLSDLRFFSSFVKEYGPEPNPEIVIFGNNSTWTTSILVSNYIRGLNSQVLVIDLWNVARNFDDLNCQLYVLGTSELP